MLELSILNFLVVFALLDCLCLFLSFFCSLCILFSLFTSLISRSVNHGRFSSSKNAEDPIVPRISNLSSRESGFFSRLSQFATVISALGDKLASFPNEQMACKSH